MILALRRAYLGTGLSSKTRPTDQYDKYSKGDPGTAGRAKWQAEVGQRILIEITSTP